MDHSFHIFKGKEAF